MAINPSACPGLLKTARERACFRTAAVLSGRSPCSCWSPQHEFALVVLINSGGGDDLTGRAANWALKDFFGLEKSIQNRSRPPKQNWQSLPDCIRVPTLTSSWPCWPAGLVGQMVSKGGFPTSESPPPPPPPRWRLDLCAKDRLIVIDGPFKDTTLDVVYKPDGSVGWMRSGGRLVARR